MERDYFNPRNRAVQIRLTKGEYAELKKKSIEDGRTVSALIRKIIVDYLVGNDGKNN